MPAFDKYIRRNRENWEQKADPHFASRFYDVPSFKKGRSSLQSVERDEVGSVRGKTLLHLQCHFGMDTLSWARLGAKVTGVDFSPKAIAHAQALATELSIPARFVCSDVYRLKQKLRGQFDIVYVSYGCLGWLPDLTRWAQIVAHYLKPGGRLCLIEFHPVYWMFDLKGPVAYPYESGDRPIVIRPQGTYAAPKAKIRGNEYWYNHSLEKILNCLIGSGLQLQQIQSYCYSPYDIGNMVRRKDGNWTSKTWGTKMPILFSLTAVRPQRA